LFVASWTVSCWGFLIVEITMNCVDWIVWILRKTDEVKGWNKLSQFKEQKFLKLKHQSSWKDFFAQHSPTFIPQLFLHSPTLFWP
jgi:hypothetical protein